MELTWGLMIVIYLFTAGLSAGAMLTSNIALLRGGEAYERIARWGGYIAPFPIAMGTGMLLLDLGSPFKFYALFLTLQVKSPMSYGSWAILIFTFLSLIYFYLWLPKKYQIVKVPGKIEVWKLNLAKILPVLALIIASYTGVLLDSAARPLWRTPVLPVLFLISAVSTGVAAVIFGATISSSYRAKHHEINMLTKVDALLVVIEIVVIAIMVLAGLISKTLNQNAAFEALIFGHYAWIFWLFIVGLGLTLPFVLELIELKGSVPVRWSIPVTLGSSFLILFGGFFVRYVVTYAGQLTNWQ